MSNDTSYNGWANYETWNWKLWLDNDQGSQEYWREQAQELWDDAAQDEGEANETARNNARYELAARLESDADENEPTGTSGPYADLLRHAIGMIDWHEIADHILDDCDTPIIETEDEDETGE